MESYEFRDWMSHDNQGLLKAKYPEHICPDCGLVFARTDDGQWFCWYCCKVRAA